MEKKIECLKGTKIYELKIWKFAASNIKFLSKSKIWIRIKFTYLDHDLSILSRYWVYCDQWRKSYLAAMQRFISNGHSGSFPFCWHDCTGGQLSQRGPHRAGQVRANEINSTWPSWPEGTLKRAIMQIPRRVLTRRRSYDIGTRGTNWLILGNCSMIQVSDDKGVQK